MIQGDVQLIPIGNAIMYVRPVWILGEGTTTFPRYLAVAAAVGQRAVLGCDMNDAVTALVDTANPTRRLAEPDERATASTTPVTSQPTLGTDDDHDHDGAGNADDRSRPRTRQCPTAPARRADRVRRRPRPRWPAKDLAGYQAPHRPGPGRRPGGGRQAAGVTTSTTATAATATTAPAATHHHDRRPLTGPGLVRARRDCYYGGSVNCPVAGPASAGPAADRDSRRRVPMAVSGIDLGKYKLGWHDTESYAVTPKKGLNEQVVRDISYHKSEPEWMTKFRLNALKRFERKPMLEWFAKNMPTIDFDDIYYYLKPTQDGAVSDWDMLPEEMKATYEKLGIPEAERKFLAGVTESVRLRGRVPQEP